MKNVPFFFKTPVFDRLFLVITDLNVPFYNNIGRCLNFLEYALFVCILLIICSANQWTGFFMIGTSVMKKFQRQIIFFYISAFVTRSFLLGLSWSSDNITASNKKNTSKSVSVYLRELFNIFTKILSFHYFINMGCLHMHECLKMRLCRNMRFSNF